MPPSQKCSPSMTIEGKPGGSAPDAMICSGPIFLPSFLNSTLSKYLKLPVVTLTAPKRCGVGIALRLRAALRPQRRRRQTRREKTGNAEGGDPAGAGLVEKRSPAV